MLLLANGCTASEPKVNPENWKKESKVNIHKDWVIQCYFRDSRYKKNTQTANK